MDHRATPMRDIMNTSYTNAQKRSASGGSRTGGDGRTQNLLLDSVVPSCRKWRTELVARIVATSGSRDGCEAFKSSIKIILHNGKHSTMDIMGIDNQAPLLEMRRQPAIERRPVTAAAKLRTVDRNVPMLPAQIVAEELIPQDHKARTRSGHWWDVWI